MTYEPFILDNHIFDRRLIILIAFCFPFPLIGNAQKGELSIVARIPNQVEFQKENIFDAINGPTKEQKAIVLNYGIDFLIKKGFSKKISAYLGTGYFRNKFNFKRPYDHELLNIGTDSIPIGTYTHNYIYNVVRFPVGLSYKIYSNTSTTYSVGGEVIFNCSFKKIYNGAKPFPNANDKLSDFQYSGNSINIFTCVAISITNCSLLELEPYIRVYNTYKQDEVLYEDASESINHSFDAFGLSLKYSLTFKK